MDRGAGSLGARGGDGDADAGVDEFAEIATVRGERARRERGVGRARGVHSASDVRRGLGAAEAAVRVAVSAQEHD